MISEKLNGGSAFGEFKQAGSVSVKQGGLTVRDYFAAAASIDDINTVRSEHFIQYGGSPGFEPLTVAEARYMHADAMLQERAK